MSAGKRIMHKSKVIICEMKAGVMHDGRPLRAIVFSMDPESVVFVYASHHADEHVVHNIRPGHVQKYQYVEEYSRVLSAAFEQDKKYSVSAEEVAAFWRFVDAYTTVWDTGVVSVESYERDTMPFIY
jgi:glucose-6-phosphate 1-dehydrogenase